MLPRTDHADMPSLSSWGMPLGIALLAVLAYVNSFPGAFILDDLHIAKNNPLFADFDLVTLLRADYWYGLENSGLYRPLTILSLYLNRLLFGEGPLGFHLVNVLLHAGVTVLLWYVLRSWGTAVVGAAIAALLFAIHPLHAGVVDVVVGRSELLAAMFVLAGLVASRREGRRGTALTGLCFLMALLSKEHGIVLLALVPLVDMWFCGPARAWRTRWPLYTTLLVVALAWLLWREFGLVNPLPRSRITEAANPLIALEPLARVLSALQLQGVYLWKMLIGADLQESYAAADLPEMIQSVWSLRGLLFAGASALLLTFCAWGWRRRRPAALFAVLYLISFAPTANVFLPIGVHFAERLAYLPSAWFCAAVAVLCANLLEHARWRPPLAVALMTYLLWLGVMTLLRNREYADEITLWSAEVQNNPRDYLGWMNLAESHANAGELAEADAAYETMLALAPDFSGGLRSRTYLLMRTDRPDEALLTAMRAYGLSKARGDETDINFDALGVAEVHLALGNYETALGFIEATTMPQIREHPLFAELRGKALAHLGRDAEAVAEFARVEHTVIGSDLRYVHGQSLFRLGRLEEARQQLELAVRAKSDGPAWNLLGVVNAQLGDLAAAAVAFEKAVALEPENTYYRENLDKARR